MELEYDRAAAESVAAMGDAPVSFDRLEMLHTGQIEAANLAECVAVDFARLMAVVFPDMNPAVVAQLDAQKGLGISKRMKWVAAQIHQHHRQISSRFFLNHSSDTVRGWGCFWVAHQPDLALSDRLQQIHPFADDSHFGVREWAWLAVRDHIAADLDNALQLLLPWAQSSSERIRRFASESIRPRGVWCRHLQPLKDNPEKALHLLEALKADDSIYVQHSVGNWLNDASKDNPDFVQNLCQRWLKNPEHIGTIKICQRATRSIRKKLKAQQTQ